MLQQEQKCHGIAGLGIQGKKGDQGDKGAGIYICKLSDFMNIVTLASDGKTYIFDNFIGVSKKDGENIRFEKDIIESQYSDINKTNQKLLLSYDNVDLEDEDAIVRDEQYETHLNNLLLTYNSNNEWYNDACIFNSDGYVKDDIRTNNTITNDASYYVKIPALRNIIKEDVDDGKIINLDKIDNFMSVNSSDFINGNVMVVEHSFNEEVHYAYVIVDNASLSSKFNSGEYYDDSIYALGSIFNEAIKDPSNLHISYVHSEAVTQIRNAGDSCTFDVMYVANTDTANRYRGIKNYFKNGDIIYFTDDNDTDIKYMIAVSDENRNKTSKELISESYVLYPFKIKYVNIEDDSLLISNYKMSIIYDKNYVNNNNDINNHKNVALSNLISSQNSFNIASILQNNTTNIPHISLTAIPQKDVVFNKSLNIYDNNNATCVSNTNNKQINVTNTYIPNTFENDIELYSPLYDKNLILFEEFIKPITNINVYLCNDNALIGCELELADYIYNTAYYDDYSYGYEIYDSNHSLIQCEQTSNETLQMFVSVSVPAGMSNITTIELNIPTYISLSDANNVVSSWSNKSYMYYANIIIGNIEYALYLDDRTSIYNINNSDRHNIIKILMPIVQHNIVEGKTIVNTSINHELYTFACMKTVDDKRQYIYYEDSNLTYDESIDENNSTKVNISLNASATKSYLTKLSKCYAYTRKIDINDISHKLAVLELPYYINSFIVCKNTGMKIYSKMTKLVCTVDIKQNSLKEYSIEILEKPEKEKYKDDISYEITPIISEQCESILSIFPSYDYVKIQEIKFGYDKVSKIYSYTKMPSNDSCTYSLEFESNLPNLSKYKITNYSTINGYIHDKDAYEYYINNNLELPSTAERNIGIYVKYNYANSDVIHYKHFNLVQPGYTDTRYIPNIKLYIETDPNILEKLNNNNPRNFKTYLKVSIDNLYETWGVSVQHPEKLKFYIKLSILDSDLEYNMLTSSDPKRSNVRPYTNISTNSYKLSINSSIATLSGSASGNNIYQDDGYYIDGFYIEDEFNFTDNYERKYDIEFEFNENVNPTLTNLFLQFYVSAFRVIYDVESEIDTDDNEESSSSNDTNDTNNNENSGSSNDTNDNEDSQSSNNATNSLNDNNIIANFVTELADIVNASLASPSPALYQINDKYNKTYTYISNKLDVTFNPIDYILCPDEYYKNEQHSIRGNSIMKYGSKLQLATSVSFTDASIYDKSMFNTDYNSELNAKNGKQLYTWKNAKVKLGYFQDNIESINITNSNVDKTVQKVKTQENEYFSTKQYSNIAITYNSSIMNPRQNINQYSFIYNNKTYSSYKYNQYVDGSLYINHNHEMKLRSNELLQSMSVWNADYSYVNTNNVCPGRLSKYGNGYMYLDDYKNKAYYAKVIGKFSYDLMTLAEVKKLNDTYVYKNQSFNEIKHTPVNKYKEPDAGGLFRSFVYNVAWENRDINKCINTSTYYKYFTLYPRILYNYDFGTLNVLTLCRPNVLNSSSYSFENNGRWF